MKRKDLKSLSKEEMEKKINELKMELMKIQTKIKIGTPPENPGQVKQIRRTIARLLTIKGEMEKKK